jgi:hypothetical protein
MQNSPGGACPLLALNETKAFPHLEAWPHESYVPSVTTLEEIEAAISKPPKEDFERLSAWNNSNQKYQTDWDRQIQENSDSGALGFLIREISDDTARGRIRPLDEVCGDPEILEYA